MNPTLAIAALGLLDRIKGERKETDDVLQRMIQDGIITNLAPINRCSMPVGRNDLCPCGSDRKFKKCCRTKRLA